MVLGYPSNVIDLAPFVINNSASFLTTSFVSQSGHNPPSFVVSITNFDNSESSNLIFLKIHPKQLFNFTNL
jgi:hypothetical protein